MTEIKALKWKKAIYFFIISSIIISILLFVKLTAFSKTKGIQGKDTAILNPKYESALSEFLLKTGGTSSAEIAIYQKDGFWQGRAIVDNVEAVFPLNSKRMAEFIKTLDSIRKVYHITDNVSLYKDYGLDGGAFFIEARDSSRAILLELFLGKLNYNGTKIAFRTGKSTAIYETQADLSPYCHTEPESWADMLLLPQTYAAFEEAEVLACIIDGAPVFQDNRTDFETFVHKVISARGSAVKPPFAANVATSDLEHILLIETPQKVVRLFFLKNTENDSYSVQNEINGKLPEYSLEISSWTFNNLFLSE